MEQGRILEKYDMKYPNCMINNSLTATVYGRIQIAECTCILIHARNNSVIRELVSAFLHSTNHW